MSRTFLFPALEVVASNNPGYVVENPTPKKCRINKRFSPWRDTRTIAIERQGGLWLTPLVLPDHRQRERMVKGRPAGAR